MNLTTWRMVILYFQTSTSVVVASWSGQYLACDWRVGSGHGKRTRGHVCPGYFVRLQAVVNKAQRYGYLPTPFKTLDELRQELNETLFHSSRYNAHHVFYCSYRDPKTPATSLVKEPTTLPSDVGSTARQNFIPRMLFTDMY